MPAGDGRWLDVPLYAPVFTNVNETALRNGWPALENAYVTEARGQSRFPGLKEWVRLPTGGRVYMQRWRDDMMCATSLGRIYRVGRNKQVDDVTGVPLTGGGRPVFAPTENEMLIAAGGPIVRYAGIPTDKLSDDAPMSTHVGYVSGFAVGNEPGSGRFRHTAAGAYSSWPPENVFTAEAQHDEILALYINDFREILLMGPESIEQWERNAGGELPFFFRFPVADGLYQPHTYIGADNGVFIVNKKREIARLTGQVSQPVSRPIQATLEGIDDWSASWMGAIEVAGQRFLVLQMPNATTPYGTKGMTIAHDYAGNRFSFLYGWDDSLSMPGRWPVWSTEMLWEKAFAGGDGVIYEIDPAGYAQDGGIMAMVGRTGHFDPNGRVFIRKARIRMRRGQGGPDGATLQLRLNADNMGWSNWIDIPLGASGQRQMYVETTTLGNADTVQFEYRVTDAVPVEIVSFQLLVDMIGH